MAKEQEDKKEPKNKKIEIAIWQYWYERPDVHPYLRAYVSAKYDGIMKTRKEWDKEVSKHL